MVLAKDLARHAVRAAEVAAVGDRDAQVVQGAATGVKQGAVRRHGQRRWAVLRAERLHRQDTATALVGNGYDSFCHEGERE